MHIRMATLADLDDILRLKALAYGEYFNEPAEGLIAKLMLANESSFVALKDDGVCAYAIAFPWVSGELVMLHSIDISLTGNANVMYIHDVAVDSQHHRKGIAQSLVDAIMKRSTQLELHFFELVAVQDSKDFWPRNVFTETGIAGAEYGADAKKMSRK